MAIGYNDSSIGEEFRTDGNVERESYPRLVRNILDDLIFRASGDEYIRRGITYKKHVEEIRKAVNAAAKANESQENWIRRHIWQQDNEHAHLLFIIAINIFRG